MAYSKKDSSQVGTYSRRLKENVKSILDNYVEIVNQSKVSLIIIRCETVRIHLDGQINVGAKGLTESHVAHVENEVKVRASNIVSVNFQSGHYGNVYRYVQLRHYLN